MAKEKYDQLVQISDDLPYKLTIASQYYKKGYKTEAMDILNKLKNSDDLNEKYESIFTYSEVIQYENIDKSLDLMDKVLKSNVSKKFKSRAYVRKFLWTGKTNNGKKNLDNALKIDKKNESAHLNYIIYYVDKNNVKKALKRIKIGLKLIPNSQEMYFLMGKINCDLGKHDLAIQYLEKSLEFDLPQIKIYVLLCLLYGLKEDENSSKYFYYAINLDGEHIYEEKHDFNNILRELVEKYLVNDKNYPNIK